jgi:signal transduction histidine kinase
MWQTQGMVHESESGRHFLPVLVTGFALLVLILLASGWIAIDSMRFVESDASRFVTEQQATARLIDEVQSEEGDLSAVFYSLAAGHDSDRTVLLKRLDTLESAVRKTIQAGSASSESRLWTNVQRAADLFMEEGRATIRSGRSPASSFYQRHQNLLAAIADLANSSFSPNGAVRAERERLSSRIGYSLLLLGIAVLVAILGAVFTVYFVNRMYLRLRWQAAELTHLSSRTMADQEDAASRLSREMHDHLGQTLSAIEANLVAMQNARAFHTGRLEDALGLVKDAVENVREISQLLRPSILDDFGLNDSIRWLADSFGERTGIDVRYTSSFSGRTEGSIETQLFRIAQEALTNVARHAQATRVTIELAHLRDALCLTVSDNGKGMELQTATTGIGLVGMRARARVARGTVSISSQPGEGVRIRAEVPLRQSHYVSQTPHTLSR